MAPEPALKIPKWTWSFCPVGRTQGHPHSCGQRSLEEACFIFTDPWAVVSGLVVWAAAGKTIVAH